MAVSGSYDGIWSKLNVVVTPKAKAPGTGLTGHRTGEGLGGKAGRLGGAK